LSSKKKNGHPGENRKWEGRRWEAKVQRNKEIGKRRSLRLLEARGWRLEAGRAEDR
jgi:hypothetical protein